MSADPSDDKQTTRSKTESHTRLTTKVRSLSWTDLTEGADLGVGLQLRGIVEILYAVHAKYRHGRPLVSSRAAWVLSLKRGVINREGEAELHSQPPPPPDASDDPWRTLVAPEVLRGKRPDERSDVFVLGGMLFEALTGSRFESPEAAVKELENARTTARAAGLGGDYWEVELLATAVRATREDPDSRWQDAKQFADEVVRIAAHRIKSRSALGAVVAGKSEPPGAPDSRQPTVRPPAEKAAPKAAAKLAEAPKPEASANDTLAKKARAPMEPAPVPKRSFTPAGLGFVSPSPAPAPATGLGPPLEKKAVEQQEKAGSAHAKAPAPKLSETGRKGTMVGLGVEIPPPPAGHEAPAPSSGAAETPRAEPKLSETGRKGTMVGLGVEIPPPPGHEESNAAREEEIRVTATGRKATFAGVGPSPLPPREDEPRRSSAPPKSPDQPGRFATQLGIGPKIPVPDEYRRTPAPPEPKFPQRTSTVHGIGPSAEVPIPEPPPTDDRESELGFELVQSKPKHRLGKLLLAAMVFIVVPLLVLRFGFREQYEQLRGLKANVQAVEAESKATTPPMPYEPETTHQEPGAETAEEPNEASPQPQRDVAQPEGSDSAALGEAAADEHADSPEGEQADEGSGTTDDEKAAAEPAPAPKPKPRKPQRRKPQKPQLKTPDYGI